MYALWTILCGPESFSTRLFYSGGGSSAGASSWKVLTCDPWPTHGRRYFGDQANLHVHNLNCLNISIVKYLLFHTPVHNVSFTTNNFNFNAGIYVNNDNIDHKSMIVTHFHSTFSPQRMYQFDWLLHLFMINSFIMFYSPTLPRPFILLFHLFIT